LVEVHPYCVQSSHVCMQPFTDDDYKGTVSQEINAKKAIRHMTMNDLVREKLNIPAG
jgi:hypothetical protein